MTLSNSRYRALALLVFTPLFVLAACQTTEPAGSPTPPPVSPTPAEPTPTPEVTVEADVEFGPGTFNLTDTTVGLADLSSYTATLSVSFNGTQEGKPSQWTKNYVMRASKEPAARMLTLDKADKDSTPLMMAEVAGAAYQRLGEDPCIATTIDTDNPLAARMEPVGFLSGVIGAQEAGSQTVNGVEATHYTFDESAFGGTEASKSTGELWVASDGGFIVRYLLTTQAGADSLGDGVEGAVTWDYELTNANKPVVIELPEDCPGGMVDAPTLPDAANIVSFPGSLSYESATSIADAGAFYQKQIPPLGWTQTGTPVVSETFTLLDFTRGSETMTIMITSEQGVTSVHILLAR